MGPLQVILIAIGAALLSGVICFIAGVTYRKKIAEREIGSAEAEATRLINDAIRSGEAAIAPAEFRTQSPCKWCSWRPVCLFDERLDVGCVRRFETMRTDEVLERLKLED